MAAVLTGKVCANVKYEEGKRLSYCNLSLGVVPFSIGSLDGHRISHLYMERGILLANAGDAEASRKDMQKALELASFGDPREKLMELANPPKSSAILTKPDPWVPKLLMRAEQQDVSEEAKRIWWQVVSQSLRGGGRE